MGLSGSVPLVLTARLVSYNDQAVFSLVSLPYSLKLLWAPIVDALYLSNRHPNSLGNRLKLGRRKSWVIPVQFLSALVMLLISSTVDELLGDDLSKLSSFEQRANAKPVQIVMLTLLFLFLYVLMATQDIAVDAWALTMLSKENVGLASSCNTIGLTAGYMISYIGFLAFNSAEFCNTWLRSVEHVRNVCCTAVSSIVCRCSDRIKECCRSRTSCSSLASSFWCAASVDSAALFNRCWVLEGCDGLCVVLQARRRRCTKLSSSLFF